MKRHFSYLFFCCIAAGCVNQSINISIAEHNQNAYDLSLRAYPCMQGFFQQPTWLPDGFCDVDFFIVVENKGCGGIGIDSDWTSWGYESIELLLQDENGFVEPLKRKTGAWSRNFKERIEILPNSILCLPISLDDGLWEQNSILEKYKKQLFDAVASNMAFDGELSIKCIISGLWLREPEKKLRPFASPWTSLPFRHKRTYAPKTPPSLHSQYN